MTTFSYTARKGKDSSNLVNGEVEAKDKESAIALLRTRNLTPIILKQKKSLKLNLFKGVGKAKETEVVLFTRQLSAMISAGIPILRSLQSLKNHAKTEAFRKILNEISEEVESGKPLSKAMESHPKTFNSIYVNMVRAGEAAGILDDVLKQLTIQQEKALTVKRRVKGAMTYPLVLIVITTIAFFGLMLFVVPRVAKVIQDIGGPDAELPAITQIMLGISHFMVSYWYILFALIGGSVYFLIKFIKTSRGKGFLSRIALKIPVIKEVVKKLATVRFSRTYTSLISVGVPVIESLDITSKAVGNLVYEKSIIDISERVKNGEQLSEAITHYQHLYPDMLVQILSVGEETGKTDEILHRVSDYYEEEFDVAIGSLSSIIEPLMIIFVGAMVGMIALSVMLPIMTLSSSIKQT